MSRTASVDITLPEESEVRAAVQGQRELAAYLATKFETQRIQILDDSNVAHQIELPTSALRLLLPQNRKAPTDSFRRSDEVQGGA
jgi:hypothetical protein